MAARVPSRRRAGGLVALLILGGALAAALALGIARARRSAHRRASVASVASAASSAASAGAGVVGVVAHVDELPDLLRRGRANPGLLVTAFAAWAGDAQALAARRILLGALAVLPQPMVRLGVLLAAVEASPLALAADPLAPDVVAAVSSIWTGDLVRKGRDLMFTETRAKAREVVIASMVALALSDRGAALDELDRRGLTSDFIDLYGRAAPAQRRDIVAVVRMLGGDDTAEVLRGNGLGDDSQLPAHLNYRRELEATRKATSSAPR